MPAGDRALLEERVVAAVVDRHLVLGQVELDDPGHHPGEELAVVGDQHDPGAQPAHERLEPLEPGQVEVVGGLVEQHDVEAAEQQRGQRGAGGLPAGQRGHQRVRADVEAEVGEHRRQPLVEVRGAAGQPVVEAVRVGVARPPAAPSPERRGGRLHRVRSPRRRRYGGRRTRRRSRPRPARAPGAASRRTRRRARSTTEPSSGSRSPARMRSSVVLPAPLAPTTPTTSPGATVRSSASKRVRCACPPARSLVTRVALTGRS